MKLKRNVGPKTKDFLTLQFQPEQLFCRLCRSISVILWDYKIKIIDKYEM